MHYRRMDPQPHPDAYLKGTTVAGRRCYYVNQPGAPVPDVYPPHDMPRAYPWQCRDKEWYWRGWGPASNY